MQHILQFFQSAQMQLQHRVPVLVGCLMDGPVPMTSIARVESAFLLAAAASNEFAVQLMGLFAAPPKVKHAKKSARNVIVILAQKSITSGV